MEENSAHLRNVLFIQILVYYTILEKSQINLVQLELFLYNDIEYLSIQKMNIVFIFFFRSKT